MGVSSPLSFHHKIYILTAHKQEVRDFNNVVKLKGYITKYAGVRKHSIYLHENTNVISATVIFNLKGFKEIDISKEIES
jgi:hypothetical protein